MDGIDEGSFCVNNSPLRWFRESEESCMRSKKYYIYPSDQAASVGVNRTRDNQFRRSVRHTSSTIGGQVFASYLPSYLLNDW